MTESSSPPSVTGSSANSAARPLAYRTARWAFGVLLALSLALLLFSLVVFLASSGRQPVPSIAEPTPTGLVLTLSIATSIVTLIGLLSTNLLAWRKEAREARATEIQLQRQQLEIEKLRLDLEKQKRDA